MSKRFLRKTIGSILAWQVRRLQNKNSFLTIAVAGSVGKTSTKRAIAQYLGSQYTVRYQDGNYNDYISVPLVYFGLSMPSLFNPFAWLRTLFLIERQLSRPYPYDVVVLELGTDAPGQIKQFAHYVKADIGVLSAITPEHMEFFSSIDDVAKEELSIAALSKKLVINIDDVPGSYLEGLSYQSYGFAANATVRIDEVSGKVVLQHDQKSIAVKTSLVGSHAQKVLACAYLVGEMAKLQVAQPTKALGEVTAMPGRMQLLTGKNNTKIIDDTYNSSPDATIAALDFLYGIEAPQKIAVLGNMNEMGGYSKAAHEQVGKYCNSSQLDEVIVLGKEAELFLAPLAKKQGNNIKIFQSPYEIGDYLADVLQNEAVVLLKGSQNGVFLEEAIKPLLANKQDESRLVRQSSAWLKKKQQQFPDVTR